MGGIYWVFAQEMLHSKPESSGDGIVCMVCLGVGAVVLLFIVLREMRKGFAA